MFKLNAGYFQLQMASERDRESAYKLVGKYLRDDAKGIPQMAYIGCIVTQSPRAESAQEVCDQLVAAAKYIDKQRIGSTDDCGFSPFSIDKKPNHGSSRLCARHCVPEDSEPRRWNENGGRKAGSPLTYSPHFVHTVVALPLASCAVNEYIGGL